MEDNVIYFEDLVLHSKQTTMGRTITETDTVLFGNFANDHRPIYQNLEHCRQYSPTGERLVDPMLLMLITTSFFDNSDFNARTGPSTIALLGMNNWKIIVRPKIGDTVHCESEIISLKSTKPDRGIVTYQTSMINQNGEIVMRGTQTAYMAKRAYFKKGK